jgi:hypothetical protein
MAPASDLTPPTAGSLARGVARWVALGTLAVAVLDILDAFLFFGLQGVSPVRILQSIAAALQGRGAYAGGAGSAALGLLLHVFISLVVVLVFFIVARALPVLLRRPFLSGPLYGLVVYWVMNNVVLPLSATPPAAGPAGAVLINGLLIHAFGVGLPAALAARAAFAGDRGRSEPLAGSGIRERM